MESENYSFTTWLRDRQSVAEKTVGFIILIYEIFHVLAVVYKGLNEVILTQILNLFFLIFIYYYLKDDFAKRYSVSADDPDVIKILRFSQSSKEKISKLVYDSNTLISQLKSINGFLLLTAGLYVLLISQFFLVEFYEHKKLELNPVLTREEIDVIISSIKYWFHFPIDLFSYAGAFYLLRCFFVMYQKTVDDEGNDVLNKNTKFYIFLFSALMILDIGLVALDSKFGIFFAELICGAVNAIILILLVARFENKILDIPIWVLCILYIYAILQTSLPFVTGGFLPKMLQEDKSYKEFLENLTSIVLAFCLIGKVALSIVFLYVLNSKRIFYYFMTLRKIHEEEENHWGKFRPLIEDFPYAPETFTIIYNKGRNSKYTATIPNLFKSIKGIGETPEKAKKDLLKKIQNVELLKKLKDIEDPKGKDGNS